MIIAVDGTSGSGKSWLCKEFANLSGFTYISSGNLYRALTYKVIKNNINISLPAELDKLLETTQIDYYYNDGISTVIMDGKDVSNCLNNIEVSSLVSQVSAIPKVRLFIKKNLADFSESKENIIMEGRDIGSVIFPNAEIKVYVDCDVQERARRRVLQYKEQGLEANFEQIKKSLQKRDLLDTTRKDSPLIRLPEAHYLNNTNLSPEKCIKFLVDLVNKNRKEQIII